MSDDSSNQQTEIRSERTGKRAALWSLGVVLVIYYILPVIAALAVYMYGFYILHFSQAEISTWLSDSIPPQFVFMVIAQGLTLGMLYLVLRRFHWTFKSIGLTRPKWTHPLIGLAAVLPYMMLYAFLVWTVSRLVPGFDSRQVQEVGFNNPTSIVQLVMTYISLVILPPLVEEITMRGFLYTGLRKWLPRIAAAVLVSVLFGAAHLAEGGNAGPLWVGALDTFALSMVLIWLRELTGNLWAGITLHALKNGIAFVAVFILHVH